MKQVDQTHKNEQAPFKANQDRALKTGRNHHTVNTGSIMESSTAYPGNTGQNPNSVEEPRTSGETRRAGRQPA